MEPPAGPNRTLVAWSFVVVQVLLMAAIVITPRGDDWSDPWWLDGAATGTLVLGLALGLWAVVCLGRGLTPSPVPYRWARHPIYTAVILIVVGVAARSGSIVVLAETAALVVLFNLKARWEEHRLTEIFPGYPRYRDVTSRFLPVRRHGATGR